MRSPFDRPDSARSLGVAPVKFEPVGRVWPNGNFSMGFRKSTATADNILWEDGGYTLPDWVYVPPAEGEAGSLTSSNALISEIGSVRARKGLNGISGYGQQMLRSAAYMVERDYGKSDLCFATLTLPTMPDYARRRLQSNWAKLLNELVKFLSRRLASAGRPSKVFGCVEVQSGRLERYREGYLHLHAVWPAHSNQSGKVWAVEWSDLRAWWKAAVERFSGYSLDIMPRVELAPIKQSAEHYLGKYLSKGGGLIEAFIEAEGEESCPTAWWFMSAPMKQAIASETVSGGNVGVLLECLVRSSLEDSDLRSFEWLRHVDLEVGGRLKTVGWCGRLTRSTADDILAMMEPLGEPG